MHLLVFCRVKNCQMGTAAVPAAALEDEAASGIPSALHLQSPSCRQRLCRERVQALGSRSRYKKGPTSTPEVKA